MDVDETEEEVEILVSFEEDGQEYHLVRLLDPVLLVGKVRSSLMSEIPLKVLQILSPCKSLTCLQLGNENTRILLTPEESDTIMPNLESMFMSYQDEED